MTVHDHLSIDNGDLIMFEDGTEAIVVRLGDEQWRPWWQSPVKPRNARSIQVKCLPSGPLRWIARSGENRRWTRPARSSTPVRDRTFSGRNPDSGGFDVYHEDDR